MSQAQINCKSLQLGLLFLPGSAEESTWTMPGPFVSGSTPWRSWRGADVIPAPFQPLPGHVYLEPKQILFPH